VPRVFAVVKEAVLEPLLRTLRLRRIMQFIPDHATVLDVGCGHSATLLKALSPRIAMGYGLDFKAPTELAPAGQTGYPNLQVQQALFTQQLPYPTASMDVVTMVAVLEHIADEAAMVAEVYRVLKPGGQLVLTVPSVWAQPVLELLAYRLHWVSEAEIRDHKRYYTRTTLHHALVTVGRFTQFRHRYFQWGMNNECRVVKP
jgi:ubiquinone/menaquinone biosynthesis C-methylase UbiE